jgi:hypothetical protein
VDDQLVGVSSVASNRSDTSLHSVLCQTMMQDKPYLQLDFSNKTALSVKPSWELPVFDRLSGKNRKI